MCSSLQELTLGNFTSTALGIIDILPGIGQSLERLSIHTDNMHFCELRLYPDGT